MDTAPSVLDAISPVIGASTVPLASVYVTLTKLEYFELVQAANSWKSLHASVARQSGCEGRDNLDENR